MKVGKIKWLLKELFVLKREQVIDSETEESIRKYYSQKMNPVNVRKMVMILFWILGSILIGAGIVLLFAHNWNVSAHLKAAGTLLCLICAQIFSGYVIRKRFERKIWRESSSIILMLILGTAIATIQQIYHVGGNLENLLFLWAISSLPIIYLLRSNSSVLIYLAIITGWAGVIQNQGGYASFYWLFIFALMPYYFRSHKHKQNLHSAENKFLQWFLLLSFCISLGCVLEKVVPGLWIVVYSSFLVILYFIGFILEKDEDIIWRRPFTTIATGGIGVVALLLSQDWPWRNIGLENIRSELRFHEIPAIIDYVLVIAFVLIALWLFIKCMKQLYKRSYDFFPLLLLFAIIGYFIPENANVVFGVYLILLCFSLISPVLRKQARDISWFGLLFLFVFSMDKLFAYKTESLGVILLIFFFVIFVIRSGLFIDRPERAPYGVLRFICLFGCLLFLYMISFAEVIEEIIDKAHFFFKDILLIITIASAAIYYLWEFIKKNWRIGAFLIVLMLLPILYIVHLEILAVILVNLYLLSVGIGITINGIMRRNFYYANVGILTISAITLTRFFDEDLTFLSRGIIFILIGSLFFLANIYISRKAKGEIK